MIGRFQLPKDTCCLAKSRKHAARKWLTRNTLTSARSTRASSPDISAEIGGPAPTRDAAMAITNLFELGVLEILRLFKAGSFTPAEYLAELRNRNRTLEPKIRAFSHLPAEIEPGPFDGTLALSGIPVGIKDVIDTAGLPTGYGSL